MNVGNTTNILDNVATESNTDSSLSLNTNPNSMKETAYGIYSICHGILLFPQEKAGTYHLYA